MKQDWSAYGREALIYMLEDRERQLATLTQQRDELATRARKYMNAPARVEPARMLEEALATIQSSEVKE